MQGIYNYIPETYHVCTVYSAAAVLHLQYMLHVMLFPILNACTYISTLRRMCAVPNMTVFCRSLTSCFLGMLLTYFLNEFETVPVAPIITGITSVFTFHMRCIFTVRSLYFRIFPASFFITFLSPGIATSINIHIPFSLSLICIIVVVKFIDLQFLEDLPTICWHGEGPAPLNTCGIYKSFYLIIPLVYNSV